MKKILLILVTILSSASGAWAEDITVNASDRIKILEESITPSTSGSQTATHIL